MKKVYPDMNIKLPGKRRLGNNFDPGTYFLLKPHKMKYFGGEMREIQKLASVWVFSTKWKSRQSPLMKGQSKSLKQ